MRNIKFSIVLSIVITNYFNLLLGQDCSFKQDTLRYYLGTNYQKASEYVIKHLDNPNDKPKCRLLSYVNLMTMETILGDRNKVDSLYSIIKNHTHHDSFPIIILSAGKILSSFYINNSFNTDAEFFLNDLMSNKTNRPKDTIFILNNLAIVKNNLKEYEESISLLKKASEFYDSLGLVDHDLKIGLVGQLGINYINTYDYEKAMKAIDECIEIAKNNLRKNELTYYYTKKAMCNEKLDKLDSARDALDSAEVYLPFDLGVNYGAFLNQKATFYGRLNDFAKAESFYKKSIEHYRGKGLKNILFNALKNLMFYMAKQNKTIGYSKYINEIDSCCSGLLDTQDSIIINSYRLFERSIKYDSDLATDFLNHSLYAVEYNYSEVREKLNEANIQYETEKKEQEIIVLNQQDEINSQKISTQKNYLYGGGAASGLIAFLALSMWRQRNKLKSFNTEISNQKDKIDTLHKELNHRVKNNLAFMTSLLEMQGRRTSSEEAKEIVQDSESRLRALSLVHSHLYDKTESTNINLKTYLQDISNNLEQIFSKPDRRLNINNDIDELEVDAEIAMRIGLVLNELVTNSIKHAFNDHKEAIVNIGSFIGADNKINLKYDDGSEFNLDTFDTSASNSMGAKLIKLIRSQLRQEVVFQFGDVMV